MQLINRRNDVTKKITTWQSSELINSGKKYPQTLKLVGASDMRKMLLQSLQVSLHKKIFTNYKKVTLQLKNIADTTLIK